MKRALAAISAAFCCLVQAATAATPANTQIVGALAEADSPRPGFTRLKITVTNNAPTIDEVVRLAGVAACSDTVCYEGPAPASVRISSTASGASTSVADLEVPHSTIKTVRFRTVAGTGVLQGSVALPQPLSLQSDFKGGQIMVVVQKKVDAPARTTYEPIAAASNYWHPEGNAIYYNPKFATKVKLPMGVTLAIPAGALPSPQVFVAAVHDTGDAYPMIDVYPVVSFTRPASVEVSAIQRAARSTISSQAPATPAPQVASPGGRAPSQAQVQAETAPAASTFEVFSTGVLRRNRQPAVQRPSSSATAVDGAVAAAAACNPAGWCNCADALAYPINQQIIAGALTPTGTTYLDWCTTIAPYVHITVSALSDSRERFTIKHDPKIWIQDPAFPSRFYKYLPLKRLLSWAPNTQVLVNGFYWEGSEGTSSGGLGFAQGVVANVVLPAGVDDILGENREGGGLCSDRLPVGACSSAGAGNKRVAMVPWTGAGAFWFDVPNIAQYSSTANSYISSSTSIVRNGVCSTDTFASRWSAIGTTASGRVILISNTSDGTTTAAEMCPVFLAMGVVNAIRLDGGPSAAMALDGVLKNPLTGLYFLKYGTARYIPYALKVSYLGW